MCHIVHLRTMTQLLRGQHSLGTKEKQNRIWLQPAWWELESATQDRCYNQCDRKANVLDEKDYVEQKTIVALFHIMVY